MKTFEYKGRNIYIRVERGQREIWIDGKIMAIGELPNPEVYAKQLIDAQEADENQPLS